MRKEKKERKREGKKCLSGLLPASFLLLALLLNVVARCSTEFADFYVKHLFPVWVETYGRLTGLFPFSVGEKLLYLGVLLTVLLAAGGLVSLVLVIGRKFKVTKGHTWIRGYRRFAFFYYWVFGCVCLIMTLNCFLLYQTSPVTERYQIGQGNKEEYGLEELTILRDYVVERANALSECFTRDEQGQILYDGDLKAEAIRQMQRLGETIDALQGFYPSPKAFGWSEFFCQQYIMGYYFPFSMEANYNDRMYITNMPVTMCHELSHLKGFIREDEANFIGYLACVDSEDLLFQYSACLSVIRYLDRDFINASGGDDEYYAAHPQICEQVTKDRIFLTAETWEQVEEKSVLETEAVKEATNTFLNTTLTLNGVADGTVSYSRVVALLLSYYDGILY